MHWIEAKVIHDSADPNLASELIGDAFLDLGVGGVSVEEPGLALDQDWAEDAPVPPQHHAVTGYLPDAPDGQRRLAQLSSALERLATRCGIQWHLECRTVAEQDWAESWKRFFWPTPVGERLVIKPSWREYAPQPGQIVLEIDPGMAFGTGTHATTALCLQMLERWLRPGMRLLDVGTGSGILLLAAARLGAACGVGLDRDPLALTVAAANLARNGIERRRFGLLAGDLLAPLRGRFDLVVANILTEAILQLLPSLAAVLAPEGVTILSGITAANRPRVLEALERHGYRWLQDQTQQEWVVCVAAAPSCA